MPDLKEEPDQIFIHRIPDFSDKFYMPTKTSIALYLLNKTLSHWPLPLNFLFLFFISFQAKATFNEYSNDLLFRNSKPSLYQIKPDWKQDSSLYKSPLFSQNEKVDAFDPFIDYNEFQDNQSEQESIIFLKNGRLLTIAVFGGYEALTYTMRDLYGDSMGTFGAYINFFFDLQFALQLHIVFPRTHYFTILQSQPSFSSYGIDFKYYFNKQNLVKGIAVLNPYVVFGPFLMKVSKFFHELAIQQVSTPPLAPIPDPETLKEGAPIPLPETGDTTEKLTPQELLNIEDFSRVGARIGLGVEIPLFKQTFIGFEISYSYIHLPFQNQNLSFLDDIYTSTAPNTQASNVKRNFLSRAILPDRPTNIPQRKFIGDLINGIIILGINF